MMNFRKYILCVFTVCISLPYLHAEEVAQISESPPKAEITFPFIGMVHGRSINVRSGGNVNYEVLTKLHEGWEVVVNGAESDWYQIVPPEGVYLWIHKSYVDEKGVTSSSVNVRSRPNLDSTINCQVNPRDVIEIINTEGEWVRIKPPLNSKAWIKKDFVVFEKPYDQYLQEADQKKKDELRQRRKAELLNDAEASEKEQDFKPVHEIDLNGVIAKYEKVLKEFPEDITLQAEIIKRIENLQRKKGLMAQSVPSEKKEVSESQENTETSSVLTKVDNLESAEPSSLEVYEGRLESEGFFRKGKQFKLIKNRRRICILQEKDIPLAEHLHENVKVYGKTVSRIYPRTPVVIVEKVELL